MKIAYFVHDYHRHCGHSRYVVELATRFAREHEVHVYADKFEGDAGDVHFHRVPCLRLNAFTTVITFPVTAGLVPLGGFDIAHTQGVCRYGANVVTAHICNRAWNNACRAVEGRLPLRQSIFNAVAGYLESALYRSRSGASVIAISNRIADDLKQHYECALNTHVIYHGVDLDTFHPRLRATYREPVRCGLNVPAEAFVFLFVGDLRKGARQVFSALAALPGVYAVFVSKTAPGPWRAAAAAAGVEDRVRFAGPTLETEQFYAAADAFVLPSQYDAFAMVTLEAMASGLPVIISSNAGASELITHGLSGLILGNASDATELAALMTMLYNRTDLVSTMGKSARSAAERHSWDSVAGQTMIVYNRLIAKSDRVGEAFPALLRNGIHD